MMWIVIGLGNPGAEYENNRHNVGYKVLDLLSERLGIPIYNKTPHYLFGRGSAGAGEAVLIKSLTYMNESGAAAQKALAAFAEKDAKLLVIYDDLDLPPGVIRIREQGGSGGHRGAESVIRRTGSEEFARLRIGIGRPSSRSKKTEADYVLSDFKKSERAVITQAVELAAEAAEFMIARGVTEAMNKYNS